MTATKEAKIVKLPALYSRRSDGKLQIWQKEVQGNKHRSNSGIVDGEIVTAQWTVCEPKYVGKKNEVTAEEQAMREAKAEWDKKIAKGYRENQDAVDDVGFFSPMLAKKWQDYKDDYQYPVFVQPKLDGLRLVAHKGGLFSRNGKPYKSIPHIAEALEPLFKKYPKAILDGEVYADKFANDFNAICSLARQMKPTTEDLMRSSVSIEYHVYDMPYAPTVGKTDPGLRFSERWQALTDILNAFAISKPIVPVKTFGARDEAEVDKFYEQFIEQGYEGLMVRADDTYENKRTDKLLKYKEFQDAEYRILEVVPGVGNRTGVAGAFICESLDGSMSFKSNIKGNMEFCRQILENPARYIGKIATIKFFNLTPAGVPRFPYFMRLREEE